LLIGFRYWVDMRLKMFKLLGNDTNKDDLIVLWVAFKSFAVVQ
jgi:hypothetical protein